MSFRLLCIATTLLFTAPCISMTAQADEDRHYKADKTEARYASITVKGEMSTEKKGQSSLEALIETLHIDTNVEVVALQVVAVAEGRVVKSKTSEPVSLRKRPGRVKFVVKKLIEKEEKLESLTVKDFITSKLDTSFSSKDGVGEAALQAFESIGQTDGVFIVATWDDMMKGDQSRGLVGFGSFN